MSMRNHPQKIDVVGPEMMRLISDLRVLHAEIQNAALHARRTFDQWGLPAICRYADEHMLHSDILLVNEMHRLFTQVEEKLHRASSNGKPVQSVR
jgi:hypothetical protein